MSEFIKKTDTVRFGVTTHNPSGGALKTADELPRWRVFEEASDTSILDGLFTVRAGYDGTYRGTFDATIANGFNSNSYYEVHASGKVGGIVGRAIIKSFVLDDIYNANIVEVSGDKLAGAYIDANIQLISDDATAADNLELQYDTTGLTGATFPANQADLDTAQADLNIITDSDGVVLGSAGVDLVWDEPTEGHTTPDTYGDALQPVYYANIKYIKDAGNGSDEYAACWYKDATPVGSGSLTNPAISVYNTNGGASLFTNQTMDYASMALGVVRYDSTLLTPSGEPFVVHVSGVIDSVSRTWKQIVGLDDIF